MSEEEVRADYEACLNSPAKSLTGTVTGPCGTNIANATVTLTTRAGAEINTTQTDSTDHYAFADVPPDFYNLTATKTGYWPDSDPVTVTAGEPATADVMLCRKGDLNINGDPADEDDLTLLKNVSLGVEELEPVVVKSFSPLSLIALEIQLYYAITDAVALKYIANAWSEAILSS